MYFKSFLVILAGLALAILITVVYIFVENRTNQLAPPELAGELVKANRMIDGRERRWQHYIPSNPANPAPLLILLTPSGQTIEQLRAITRYRFEELAEKAGVILLYAEGWTPDDNPEWNDCISTTRLPAHEENIDDLGFLIGLLGETSTTWNINPKRVYSMGLSDGGAMTYRLATEYPDLFAAGAIVIMQQAHPENSHCTAPKGPIPLLIMNGTEDPLVPFQGGIIDVFGLRQVGRVHSMDGTVNHWRNVNGVGQEVQPIVTTFPDIDPDDGSTVTRKTWYGPDDNDVVVYEIRGGGHTLPQGTFGLPGDWILGPTNRDINGSEHIWDFLMSKEN